MKAHVCLFICFSTRAIHLELVSDLSTEAFLAAFRRFAARRGCPEEVHSDNGSNYIGANHELEHMYNLLTKEQAPNSFAGISTILGLSGHLLQERHLILEVSGKLVSSLPSLYCGRQSGAILSPLKNVQPY